jgi:phosphoserine phosphatase
VQNDAKKSQEKHEALIAASKEIEDLKKEEEEAFKNFIDYKKKFNETNDQLKSMLRELKELSEKAGAEKEEYREKSDKKKKESLEQKKLSVEEKIKKGMKLTTEDLIAFQGMSSDD